MPIVICKECGAKYSYEEMKIQMRDKDSERCQMCGNVLLKWNGGVTCYDFKLISQNEDSNLDETEQESYLDETEQES